MKTVLRKSESNDFEFAFEAKKQAMGPHIASKWGWDEEYQLAVHRQRWQEKPWFIICLDESRIGTVSVHELENSIRFGEFYLLSQYQRKGLGTTILREFLADCDKKGRKAILEYLKWNPVGTLYRRHGFQVVSENDIHYFMERIPKEH